MQHCSRTEQTSARILTIVGEVGGGGRIFCIVRNSETRAFQSSIGVVQSERFNADKLAIRIFCYTLGKIDQKLYLMTL